MQRESQLCRYLHALQALGDKNEGLMGMYHYATGEVCMLHEIFLCLAFVPPVTAVRHSITNISEALKLRSWYRSLATPSNQMDGFETFPRRPRM